MLNIELFWHDCAPPNFTHLLKTPLLVDVRAVTQNLRSLPSRLYFVKPKSLEGPEKVCNERGGRGGKLGGNSESITAVLHYQQ